VTSLCVRHLGLGVCALLASCGDDRAPVSESPPFVPVDTGVALSTSDAGPIVNIDARVPMREAGSITPPAAPDASRLDDGGRLSSMDGASNGVSLRLLTYNVAGLPEGISQSMPQHNSALISPLLNGYDIALLQEDFSYHAQIVGASMHPYVSPFDTRGNSLGDGLSFLSGFAYSDFQRDAWTDCNGVVDNGSDCLTPKGFAFARFQIGDASVDIYDMHTDAGSAAADQTARARNLRQLAAAITTRSGGRAVIVAGDSNARYSRAGDTVPELVDAASLSDVWIELHNQGQRPASGMPVMCSADDANDPACERIDKIFYRSGGGVTLRPREYRVEGAKFVDEQGAQLSDHRPVSVVFDVSTE
jgi:endonuclease/exonuclease/phosphatase family metal-dependent hydrolase